MSLGTRTRSPQLKKIDLTEESLTSKSPPERGEVERRCTQALLTIVPQLRQIISREQENEGPTITVQQYSVLKVLHEQERLISELADMLKVSRPTMSRIIDGLEGRRAKSGEASRRPKLVERIASQDDHRLVYACITEEGRAFLRHYRVQAEESVNSVLRRLPPDELPVMLHSLERLAQAIQAQD